MFLAWREGVVGGRGVLDAAGLAASADLDLRLDHDRLADFLGDRLGVLGGVGHPARRGRDVVLGEQFLRLILEKIHGLTVFARLELLGRLVGGAARGNSHGRTVSTLKMAPTAASADMAQLTGHWIDGPRDPNHNSSRIVPTRLPALRVSGYLPQVQITLWSRYRGHFRLSQHRLVRPFTRRCRSGSRTPHRLIP